MPSELLVDHMEDDRNADNINSYLSTKSKIKRYRLCLPDGLWFGFGNCRSINEGVPINKIERIEILFKCLHAKYHLIQILSEE